MSRKDLTRKRKLREEELISTVMDTVRGGGNVLLPTDTAGKQHASAVVSGTVVFCVFGERGKAVVVVRGYTPYARSIHMRFHVSKALSLGLTPPTSDVPECRDVFA